MRPGARLGGKQAEHQEVSKNELNHIDAKTYILRLDPKTKEMKLVSREKSDKQKVIQYFESLRSTFKDPKPDPMIDAVIDVLKSPGDTQKKQKLATLWGKDAAEYFEFVGLMMDSDEDSKNPEKMAKAAEGMGRMFLSVLDQMIKEEGIDGSDVKQMLSLINLLFSYEPKPEEVEAFTLVKKKLVDAEFTYDGTKYRLEQMNGKFVLVPKGGEQPKNEKPQSKAKPDEPKTPPKETPEKPKAPEKDADTDKLPPKPREVEPVKPPESKGDFMQDLPPKVRERVKAITPLFSDADLSTNGIKLGVLKKSPFSNIRR